MITPNLAFDYYRLTNHLSFFKKEWVIFTMNMYICNLNKMGKKSYFERDKLLRQKKRIQLGLQ